ncbi:MAG: LLM class F420-dependent oxidoreductase [Actinomycetota bacterium]
MPAPTRLGVVFDYADDFTTNAAEVTEFERVGVDLVSVAEAYSFDAVSQLGYLAAITSTMTLASGILPIYSRTPALLAMTAAGLDSVSGGRFELGIGSSGAQVIEGFHGVPFTAPLGRIRENVEICRAIWRRERLDFHGSHYTIPLPADQGRGLGKPLKIINRPVRDAIPISIAALTPKAVAQAAEIADGWLPLFYLPEKADAAWGASLAEGKSRRSPDLGPLDIVAQMPFYLGDHTDRALETYRQNVALYIGGMGARGANFYNDLAVGYGFADEAATVQELYLTGRKDEAAAALPGELVTGTALIGTDAEVRARVEALVASGVSTVSVKPLAPSPGERIEQLEALRGILG